LSKKIDLAVIGKVKRIQGNKGELRILVLSDFPERFSYLKWVYLVDPNNFGRTDIDVCPTDVEGVRWDKEDAIIKFKGIDERADAFNYRKFLIAIPAEERVELPEDVYYIDEIEGLNVFTESGELLGNVDYVMTTGGVDVYVIRKGNSELMIPAKKEFIISVNISEKKMIVKLPEGLQEIYKNGAK